MKIKFLAKNAPDYYTINGDVITAYVNGQSATYDLTDMPEGATLADADQIGGIPALRGAERVNGKLEVVLAQRVIASQYPDMSAHWRGQQWIDAADYDPDKCYITPTGLAGVEDYEIVRGVDVAGVEGWTVRKKEVAANG